MKVVLQASVRRVGVIGKFYLSEFEFEVDGHLSKEQIKDRWFVEYGNEWELFTFGHITLVQE